MVFLYSAICAMARNQWFQRRPQIGMGSSFKGSVEQNEYSGNFVFFKKNLRPKAFGVRPPVVTVTLPPVHSAESLPPLRGGRVIFSGEDI